MATDDLTTGNAPEGGRWAFDAGVTEAFDDMLRRSIPDYESMRKMVTDAACWLAARSSARLPLVVDMGCSRGEALQPIVDRLGARSEYVGLEVSEPMLEAARARFEGWPMVDIRAHDLREGLPTVRPAAAILSVLTLQFTPIEYRQRILRGAYEALSSGGGMVLVEKVLGASAELDAMLVDLYYELKRGNGYSQDAIDRKRLSLEGVLVPVTAAWNEELLRAAGFAQVDCVWAWANFRAWVALK